MSSVIKFILLVLIIALSSSACTHWNHTNKNSDSVQLYFAVKHQVDDALLSEFDPECKKLGEVIGSEGHWYNFLFMNNDSLVQGALNDIKNKAYRIGGDKVIVYEEFQFNTSVTLLGQVYSCKVIAAD